MYPSCKLAGVLFSLPFLNPVTLTTTLTGLRRPVLTRSPTASVIVALNRPVRRCLGRAWIIFVRDSLKPMSNNRSASSIMRSSRDFRLREEEEEVMISQRRPGVPIRIVGRVDLRDWRSSRTEEAPPMRRTEDIRELSSLGRTCRKPSRTEWI